MHKNDNLISLSIIRSLQGMELESFKFMCLTETPALGIYPGIVLRKAQIPAIPLPMGAVVTNDWATDCRSFDHRFIHNPQGYFDFLFSVNH